MLSRIQKPRPCVAIARSSPWTIRSRTDECGRLSVSPCQSSPSLNETYTSRSVPANSSPLVSGSARTTFTDALSASPRVIFVHVLPPSCVRKTSGVRSSTRKRETEMYAVPGSKRDASICVTLLHEVSSFGVTSVQVAPPSRVTCTTPSSDPVQMTLTFTGDGPIA